MSFVVDKSIALAWCFKDEQTPAIMALLGRVTETGAVAPQLWPIEALNGLLFAERRGRITPERRQSFTGVLQRLPITLDDETAPRLWTATARLAEQHRLTAYDAVYLELAVRLRLPLATGDKALIAAAGSEGVALLP